MNDHQGHLKERRRKNGLKTTTTALSTLAILTKRLADRGLVLILRLGSKNSNGFVIDFILDKNRPDYDAIVERAKEIRDRREKKESLNE